MLHVTLCSSAKRELRETRVAPGNPGSSRARLGRAQSDCSDMTVLHCSVPDRQLLCSVFCMLSSHSRLIGTLVVLEFLIEYAASSALLTG